MPKLDRVERRERWRSLIEEQRRSGQSILAFCREKGISQPSFYAWRKRFRERKHDDRRSRKSRRDTDGHDGDREFIPLELCDSASALEVVHPLGYKVRVIGEVNLTALRQVLEVLDGRGDG